MRVLNLPLPLEMWSLVSYPSELNIDQRSREPPGCGLRNGPSVAWDEDCEANMADLERLEAPSDGIIHNVVFPGHRNTHTHTHSSRHLDESPSTSLVSSFTVSTQPGVINSHRHSFYSKHPKQLIFQHTL